MKVLHLMSNFVQPECQHVYRAFNQPTNDLSKRAMDLDEGLIYVEEYKYSVFVYESQISYL